MSKNDSFFEENTYNATKTLLLGFIKISLYVEDRGDKIIAIYKHFFEVKIFGIWNIRCTFRSNYINSFYVNSKEYEPV